MTHRWDQIRLMRTDIEPTDRRTHESVTRGFQILREARAMLVRGDSVETVLMFIEWAATPSESEGGP